jgi:hypothetical protein
MSTSSLRRRVVLGGILSLAVVVAPLSVAAASRPAVVPSTPAHTQLPFLTRAPRTIPPAQVSFTVNTANDTHAAIPTSGHCADSAGACSIRAAVEVADAIDQTVTINIPAGSYPLTIGALEVTDPAGVQLLGAGAASTTIVGAASNDVLDVDTASASAPGGFAALTTITLSGAEGVSVDGTNDTLELNGSGITGSTAGNGAAVYDAGQLWATNSSFTDNHATVDGGAIFDDQGSVRLDGDTFAGNTAASSGGAVYQADGPVAIDNSTFTSNSVTDTSGSATGGAVVAGDEMELTNDRFAGNSAVSTHVGGTSSTNQGYGGAVYDGYGLIAVAGSTFTGNTASGTAPDSEGGAFYDESGVDITGSTFSGNTVTDGDGGAISEDGAGVVLSADTLSGNTATGSSVESGRGGGLFAEGSSNISNTTLSGNHADSGGGGIYTASSEILSNSLVSGNTSNLGAGIFGDWNLQASSSAVVDNVASGPSNAGGGLYFPASGANRADFQAVTVAGNVAGLGAGFAIASAAGPAQAGGGTLADSTVADNRTPAGTEQDCALIGPSPQGLPLSSGGGNVTGDSSCGFTTTSDRQGAGAQGYWMVASDGGVFNYDAAFFGSMGGKPLNKPIVGLAHTPGNQGYWEVASDGGIFSFGDAGFSGSMGGKVLNAPVVGVASTPDGNGYVEVASDGGVFTFGDAGFYGSMGGQHLNKPIVGIAVTPDGRGYWEVASDGGIFDFGDAGFYGSMGGKPLNKPIVGIAAATDGAGYEEVASDGGIFDFGSAHFFGSAGSLHLNAPVVGIAVAPDNAGYWTFASDGGVFNYGTGSLFMGSAGSLHLNRPVVGGAAT